MRNVKTTVMVAGALAAGLVLGGVGIASASMGAGPSTMVQTRYAAAETTPAAPISGDTTASVPSTDTTQPVTPPSGDTTQPATPPTGDTTASVTPTCTPRPLMPPKAKGHAYGRMMSHPHSGLHMGQRHAAKHAAKHATASRAVSASTRRHGSMMGR